MFTPVETTIGALLIHLATTSYLATCGKTVGFSSVASGSVFAPSVHNVSIVLGVALSAALVQFKFPDFVPQYDGTVTLWHYAASGALVGFGTKLGAGCTSGHMINGLSRLRFRSLVAVMCFCSSAIFTTWFLGLAPMCVECYRYDTSFALPNKYKAGLQAVLAAGFVSSYLVLPYMTKALSSRSRAAVHFFNGLSAGFNFGLGLLISGMATPSKTLGFLSVASPRYFDPSLALIVVFTIIPNVIVWNSYVLKRKDGPISGAQFDLPTSTKIPAKFVLGNVIFGIGWGSLGVCPGPGILGVFFNGFGGAIWMMSFLIFYKVASRI